METKKEKYNPKDYVLVEDRLDVCFNCDFWINNNDCAVITDDRFDCKAKNDNHIFKKIVKP